MISCDNFEDDLGPWSVHASGIQLQYVNYVARWQPMALVDGTWRGGGDNGDCSVHGQSLRCPLGGGLGEVGLEVGASKLTAWVKPSQSAKIQGLEVRGHVDLNGATAWLSNGFQSWSQSGVVALRDSIDPAELEAALAARGDIEVIRTGHELSWWLTATENEQAGLAMAVLDVKRFKAWAQLTKAADGGVDIRLVSGAAGEEIDVGVGGRVEGETWMVAMRNDADAALDLLSSSIKSRPRAEADAGWNSWYELWDGVKATDVLENAAIAAKLLKSGLPKDAPPLRIVIDDGWQKDWGDWTPNDKFPDGLDGLAKKLKADGFEVGVWLAPLLVRADSKLAKAHPEWLVQGAKFPHLKMGSMAVLDVTHPEAAAHLAAFIKQVVSWDMGLLKIDFLFAGTWEGGRHKAVTGMEAYNTALAIIREAAGPDTILLAVGSPPVPTLRHVDAWRVGGDIAVENFGAAWAFLPSQLRSLSARWPYCLKTLCDADPIVVRDLPKHEVEFGAWVAALGGGALFLSDDLRKLPAERHGWGLDQDRIPLGIRGFSGRPERTLVDDPPQTLANALFDHLKKQSTHVVPVTWKTQDNRRIAFNVSDEAITVSGTKVPAHAAVVLPKSP